MSRLFCTPQYEPDFATFGTKESVFVGAAGVDGCGVEKLSASAEFDRGLGVIIRTVGIHGEVNRAEYDGFGRVTRVFRASPTSLGATEALPYLEVDYIVTTDASVTPYSLIHTKLYDGLDSGDPYRHTWAYLDGGSSPLVVLTQADPTAGDKGSWVVTDRKDYNARGLVRHAYQPTFWSGTPTAFPFSAPPSSPTGTAVFDSFDRPVATFHSDGRLAKRIAYHATSREQWDGEGAGAGSHAGARSVVLADGHGRPVLVQSYARLSVGGPIELVETRADYLPTNEPYRITRSHGTDAVVRWVRYDSLGRMVMNVEPNTSVGFVADVSTSSTALKAWRYAYNDNGQLVGSSDARGCGQNLFYDSGGRLIGEDYSPCRSYHAAYTPANPSTGVGLEVTYLFGKSPLGLTSVTDRAGRTLALDAESMRGRAVGVLDRGALTVTSYDLAGRVAGTARRIANGAGGLAPTWYVKAFAYDSAWRVTAETTGGSVPELAGASGASLVTYGYSRRGQVVSLGSSYGTLVASATADASGLPLTTTYGDAAATRRERSYDERLRLRSVGTYRGAPALWTTPPSDYLPSPVSAPTLQQLLDDYDLEYDDAGNIVELRDWRLAAEWPAGAKPVTRKFAYDDLYRLNRVDLSYPGPGTDTWVSPYDAELKGVGGSEPPAPHTSSISRPLWHSYRYDFLGNLRSSDDDAHTFADRSLGTQSHGSSIAGPYRLLSASNRGASGAREGDLEVGYDAAGDVETLIVRRDGPCLPTTSSCWARFQYEWDEVGRLSRAQRWDLAVGSERVGATLTSTPPARTANADVRNIYDAGDTRVVRTWQEGTATLHDVYVFDSLELRRTSITGSGGTADYTSSSSTEVVYLCLNGSRQARVVYAPPGAPSVGGSRQRVFLLLGDSLGSTSIVIDKQTGELVEQTSYGAMGSADSDLRPERWKSFREAYRFTGKEDDVQVGLTYFGRRHLSSFLGRWMSPDPLAIHVVGMADPNLYAYVSGRFTTNIDPIGLEPFTIGAASIVTAALIGAAIGAGTAVGVQLYKNGKVKDYRSVLVAAGTGAVTGAVGATISGPVSTAFSNALLAQGGMSVASVHLKTAAVAALSGAATGAVTGALNQLIANWSDKRAASEGLGQAALTGAASGAATGFAGYAVAALSKWGIYAPKGYDSAKAAIVGRLSEGGEHLQGVSESLQKEVGFAVIESGGKYYTTPGVVGTNNTVKMPQMAGQAAAAGSKLVGFFHTHPSYASIGDNRRMVVIIDGRQSIDGGIVTNPFSSGDAAAAQPPCETPPCPGILGAVSTGSGHVGFYYPSGVQGGPTQSFEYLGSGASDMLFPTADSTAPLSLDTMQKQTSWIYLPAVK